MGAQLSKAVRLDIRELRSCVFINNKKESFTGQQLNKKTQVSPLYWIATGDAAEMESEYSVRQ